MPLDKPYTGIPGTTIFDADQSRKGYWLNQFCMSLMKAENRERLVLKPNDDYGGHGIVLGWLVSDDEWTAAVQTALTRPHVVQERIILPTEPYPSWVDGQVQVTDRMLDLAPYITMTSHVDGALTRIATDPLLNVTAGGGSSVATMLVEPR